MLLEVQVTPLAKAIREAHGACPCMSLEFGVCDIGCDEAGPPHPEVAPVPCIWPGHEIIRNVVRECAKVAAGCYGEGRDEVEFHQHRRDEILNALKEANGDAD
jgi:hypothetical protein